MLRAQLRARARAEACSTSSQNKIKSFFQKVCQEREELKNVEQSDDDSIGSVPKEFLKKDKTFKMGTEFQIGFLR